MNLAVEVHQQGVDGEVAAAQVFFEGRGTHVRLSRAGIVRLGSGGDELDQVPRQRDLGGAESLEDRRFARARELGEPASHVETLAVFDHDVHVGVRAAEQLVAHIAADDPGARAHLGRGLPQKPEDLLLAYCGYWLIPAHSTAPTWPAQSPRRARRTRGRRAGLMNGEERRVSSMVGATSFQERVTPPPMTNISGSMALVRLISASPM